MKKKNNTSKKVRQSLADKLIKNKKEKFDEKFTLAPKGILLVNLMKYFDANGHTDLKKLEAFSRDLLHGLSELATRGQKSDMFGDDFNDFFCLFIKTLKNSAKLLQILEDHGIDISELNLDDEGEENE